MAKPLEYWLLIYTFDGNHRKSMAIPMKKMNLQELFGNKDHSPEKEWKTESSIYRFLLSNLDSEGRLSGVAYNLPDEANDDEEIRFAPGLKDALFSHGEDDDSDKIVSELSFLLKKITLHGDKFSEWQFYQLVTDNETVIDVIDELLNTIISDSSFHNLHLYSFAKSLATETNKRNAVKFGIALLGICQDESAIDDIKILGTHDEFTVYSTVAIMNLSSHPVEDLWELGRKVDGWGKIQLVERLSEMDLKQEIRDWLVMDGYKNDIMNEYLALTCAIHGQLDSKLACQQIDDKLFKSASELIVALIHGDGSSDNIANYPQAASVIKDFLYHARLHTKNIADFITLHTVKDYLTKLHDAVEEQHHNGWDQDLISDCLIDIVEILKSIDWKPQIHDGLKSQDKQTYWDAKQAAEISGIDLWNTVWERLCNNPLESSTWYDVTHYARPEHTNQIIDFALIHLPLDECAQGPKDSLGFGKDYDKYMSLDYVITYLENYPQKGEKIIITGLQSPVTRNRNMALKVLNKWKKENWSANINAAVLQLKETEANSNTRNNIDKLLNGQELE